MLLNEILENKEYYNLLQNSIKKTYYRFRLNIIDKTILLDIYDFEQEVYLSMIPKLKKFDSEKSTLKTYIPLLVMSCAKNCIQKAVGQAKGFNNVDAVNSSISLNYSYDDEFSTTFDNCIAAPDNSFNVTLVNDIMNSKELKDIERKVLKMYTDGFSMREIGEQLECSQSYISLILSKTKKKILKNYSL
jgi:RNA polymerase sigma factor (sigma-70 family)